MVVGLCYCLVDDVIHASSPLAVTAGTPKSIRLRSGSVPVVGLASNQSFPLTNIHLSTFYFLPSTFYQHNIWYQNSHFDQRSIPTRRSHPLLPKLSQIIRAHPCRQIKSEEPWKTVETKQRNQKTHRGEGSTAHCKLKHLTSLVAAILFLYTVILSRNSVGNPIEGLPCPWRRPAVILSGLTYLRRRLPPRYIPRLTQLHLPPAQMSLPPLHLHRPLAQPSFATMPST